MTHVNIFLNISNYQRLEKLGEGTYGKVFKAKSKDYGELYAAKISKIPVFQGCEEKEATISLFTEVNLFSALNHPSIIKFIGYSSIDFDKFPNPTMITEYAPKGSLQNILQNASKVESWDQTKKLINIYGIASGMNYLHSNDIIHHDLKPENILMDEKLQPKISDFGLSKLTNFNETFNIKEHDKEMEAGTIIYAPPEAFDGKPFTKAGDVYAYGLIIYQIMEDKDKYIDNFSFKRILCLVEGGERPEFTNKTPEPYRKLISRCWSQNPSDRPTFSEILIELKNCDYLTKDVNEDAFYDYVEYVDDFDSTFELSKRSIQFEEFIQGRKKMRMRSNAVKEIPPIVFEFSSKAASTMSPNDLLKGRRRSNCTTQAPDQLFAPTKMEEELAKIQITDVNLESRKRRYQVREPPKNLF